MLKAESSLLYISVHAFLYIFMASIDYFYNKDFQAYTILCVCVCL